ncbi:hypothetical protein BGZ82_011308 [Podila clonocystis]|nr:hypothetical protein BGZ82_011308 [Podila clonocystis]
MSETQLALTIPHICDDIVCHLSNEDVRNCITVSKDFHQTFVPYTWRTISIFQRSSYKSLSSNILASESQILIENQPKIQTLLSVYGETWDLFVKRADISSDPTDTLIPQYTPRAPFTNLTVLHALSNTDEVGCSLNNSKYFHQLLAVIQHSPRLLELVIIDHCSLDKMQLTQFAEIIRGHPSLKDLNFKADEIHCSVYRKLLWAFWNLERVCITASIYTNDEPNISDELRKSEEAEQELDAWIAENRPEVYAATKKGNGISNEDDARPLFPLKEFYICSGHHDSELGMTFQFLRRCPNLERLRPPHINSGELLESIKAAIPEHWPNLEHLDMGNFIPNRTSGDEHNADLLAACASAENRAGGLKSIVLSPTSYPSRDTAHSIYTFHAETLVELNLVGCAGFASHFVHRVLTTCPNLESLVALTETLDHPPPVKWKIGNVLDDPVLEATALEYAPEWVCLGLKTLRIQFCNMDMSDSESRYNRAGIPKYLTRQIERLGDLRDLRLCLKPPTWEDSDNEDSDFEYSDFEHSDFEEEEPEWWYSAVKVWGPENVNDAIEAFSGLKHLQTLELRNLKEYIKVDSLDIAKSFWNELKWVYYS